MAGRRRRLPTSVREVASCSELRDGIDGTTNTMYGPNVVQLANFSRASAIASQYQEFRITNVKWTFKPRFDTFQATPDATNQVVVPQLYVMKDLAQSIPSNATLATLRSMGARPKRFDDKNIVVKYAPGVQTSVNNGAGLASLSKPLISPWLSTNASPNPATWTASDVDHSGLWVYLDCPSIYGDGRFEYGIECEVQFQFRKPLASVPPSSAPPAVSFIHDETLTAH